MMSSSTVPPTTPPASSALNASMTLPPGTSLLHDQVAGHKFGQCKFKYGLLRHTASGDILKPICDRRSERELQFYQEVFGQPDDCVEGEQRERANSRIRLRKLLSTFNGTYHDEHYNMDYIRLGDVLAGLHNASVMDIKIGPKTYDPEATQKKILCEMSKYEHAALMGFRILGMRIYREETDDYLVHDKHFGLSVIETNAASDCHQVNDCELLVLLSFTLGDVALLGRYLVQINCILEWFEHSNINLYKFISSSLLFVHGRTKTGELNVHVKMIDFAHVFPNTGRDDNYLLGLKKLIFFLGKATSTSNN